jgi:uncharacterized membrane protein
MRNLLQFIKTTTIGGFLVLLPVVAALVLLAIAVNGVVSVIAPLASKLPVKTVSGYATVIFLAVLLILGFCFLAGLLVRLRLGQLLQTWVEVKVLQRLPGYSMMKSLTHQLAGKEGAEFTPALVDLYGSETRVVGLIVEELNDGRLTIFVPISPTSTLGQVYILPSASVTRLNASFLDVVNSLTQWGMESKKMFQLRLP